MQTAIWSLLLVGSIASALEEIERAALGARYDVISGSDFDRRREMAVALAKTRFADFALQSSR